MKVYTLNKIKGRARFYTGTGRLYLTEASGHAAAIIKARNESKNGDSVNIYIEADNAPLQMIRAYKNGRKEYTAAQIQTN